MKQSVRVSLIAVAFVVTVLIFSGAAWADSVAYFTKTNDSGVLPCSSVNPCGSIDIALGTGSFSGDLSFLSRCRARAGLSSLTEWALTATSTRDCL